MLRAANTDLAEVFRKGVNSAERGRFVHKTFILTRSFSNVNSGKKSSSNTGSCSRSVGIPVNTLSPRRYGRSKRRRIYLPANWQIPQRRGTHMNICIRTIDTHIVSVQITTDSIQILNNGNISTGIHMFSI